MSESNSDYVYRGVVATHEKDFGFAQATISRGVFIQRSKPYDKISKARMWVTRTVRQNRKIKEAWVEQLEVTAIHDRMTDVSHLRRNR